MNPQGAVVFLLDFALSEYIFIVLTLFVLQLARADFYNSISVFVSNATTPLLKAPRRIVPGYCGLDVSSFAMVCALN